MGIDKVTDLRTKTDDQLGGELNQLSREAFNLRFQAATGQIEKPSRIREVRRSIARIMTLQGEREKGIEPGRAKKAPAKTKKAASAKQAAPKKAAPKASRSKRAPKKK